MRYPVPSDTALRTLEQELSLLEGAIDMVASGAAPAVSLGGLRFGEQLLRSARRMALRAGVRVVPLWTVDEMGAAIRIERLGDGIERMGDG